MGDLIKIKESFVILYISITWFTYIMNNLSHSDEINLDVRDMNCEVHCPFVQQTYSILNPGKSFVLVHVLSRFF